VGARPIWAGSNGGGPGDPPSVFDRGFSAIHDPAGWQQPLSALALRHELSQA